MLSSTYRPNVASRSNPQRSFRIGQNREGRWVVVESSGVSGGIFKSRDAAVHYAAFETDRRPGSIQFWPEPIELKI